MSESAPEQFSEQLAGDPERLGPREDREPQTEAQPEAPTESEELEHPELEIDLLEYDETIPPRPEEEVADAGRATPDPH